MSTAEIARSAATDLSVKKYALKHIKSKHVK